MSVNLSDRLQAVSTRVEPTALGTVGLLATAAAFAVVANPLGRLVGPAIAVLGVFVPPVAVFGLGQAAILALLPDPGPIQLAVVEGALFLVLVGPATRTATRPLLALSAGLFGLLAAVVWYGVRTVGITTTGVALLLGVGLLAYGIHRYERVVTDLAGGEAP